MIQVGSESAFEGSALNTISAANTEDGRRKDASPTHAPNDAFFSRNGRIASNLGLLR